MKYFLAFLVGALVGGFAVYQIGRNAAPVETVDVVLERIESVLKLTTVEGHFAELYEYDNYQGDFPSLWEKKALVRIKATVSAGFDLNELNIQADEATRTLRMRHPGNAKILAIDHTLDYYDLQNGLFSDFSRADHNLMQGRAKDFIRQVAEKSPLLPKAQEEGDKTLEMLGLIATGMGWQLEIEPSNAALGQ